MLDRGRLGRTKSAEHGISFSSRSGEAPTQMKQKILIIDDTEATLGALAELVSAAGFDVVTAADFDAAKRQIELEEPDLLIVDIRLGPYNGLHLVVRERLAHPDRPVIMTTGFPDALLEAEARRYGAEFMEKPIRSADLIALVRKLLAPKVDAS